MAYENKILHQAILSFNKTLLPSYHPSVDVFPAVREGAVEPVELFEAPFVDY